MMPSSATHSLASGPCRSGSGFSPMSYFMLRAPNRLQLEEFVLRQQELTIIERKQAPPIPLNTDLADGSALSIGDQTPDAQADPE